MGGLWANSPRRGYPDGEVAERQDVDSGLRAEIHEVETAAIPEADRVGGPSQRTNTIAPEARPMTTPDEIDALLASSFADRRFSRKERQSLIGLIDAAGPDLDRAAIRRRAFEIAREALAGEADRLTLDWVADLVQALREDGPPSGSRPSGPTVEAYFSPGDDCPSAIERFVRSASRTLEICVFTITDDRLTGAVLDAHRRKVAVRVVTDNAKAEDLGSDVDRLERAGVPVRVDRSPFHMHHKFAVADGRSLLTGSYNWTRGAALDNEENLIITDDPRPIGRFLEVFERLWRAFA